MNDAEAIAAFQEANTFECSSLRARITKEQCAKNQAREMFVCQTCKGENVHPIVKLSGWKQENLRQKQFKEVTMSTPCKNKCGKIQVRLGLCSGCFFKEHGIKIGEYLKQQKEAKPQDVVTAASSSTTTSSNRPAEREREPSPARDEKSGLEVLLDGAALAIPHSLQVRMQDKGITFNDIISLVELLLDGKLRKVV